MNSCPNIRTANRLNNTMKAFQHPQKLKIQRKPILTQAIFNNYKKYLK